MWIKHDSESTVSHWSADVLGDLIDDPVTELPGNARGIECDGPMQVRDDVGQRLIDSYDAYRPYQADDSTD